MAVKQIWQCPKCNWRYHSPLAAASVTCPNGHAGKTVRVDAQLIWELGDAPLEDQET